MTKLGTLRDLYIEELKDIYSAENLIVSGLPRMVDRCSSPDLRNSFNQNLEQTRRQVQRLDRIFNKLGEKPTGRVCKGMNGILDETKERMAESATDAVMDACLISQAQHVEHYQMASYGSAIEFAKLLGDQEAVTLLQTTLDEERQTDAALTRLATQRINQEANGGHASSGRGSSSGYAGTPGGQGK